MFYLLSTKQVIGLQTCKNKFLKTTNEYLELFEGVPHFCLLNRVLISLIQCFTERLFSWYRGPDFLSQPMRNPGSQGLKTTNFPNLRSNQDRDLDLPVTSQSVLHPSETSVPLAVFPGPGCEGSHCPGPQLSSGFISDHGHSLPPGRAAPSGCSCYQQESDDCPAITFPDWSGDTNSHSQS